MLLSVTEYEGKRKNTPGRDKSGIKAMGVLGEYFLSIAGDIMKISVSETV